MRTWTWLAALALGCVPPSLPPAAAPDGAPQDAGPFAVLSVSARGALTVAPEEITVVFTRAMHPIEAATADASSVGRLERASDHTPAAGSWAWFGSRTAVFRPKEGVLPAATSFVLTIPAATQALDGSHLEAAQTIAFSTPRPRLVSAQYQLDESTPGQLLPHVDISFNVRMRARDVERSVHLEGKRHGQPFRAPFRVQPAPSSPPGQTGQPDERDPSSSFSSLPDRELATVEDLAAVADVGLASPEGPLVSQDMGRLEAGSTGPVQVTVGCTETNGACDPDDGVELRLSKWTHTADLLARLDPRPKGKLPRVDPDEQTQEIDLRSLYSLTPGTTLRLKVRAGLAMTDGESLAEDRAVQVVLADRTPRLGFEHLAGHSVVEAARPALAFTVSSVNVPGFDVTCALLDERDLPALLTAKSDKPESVRGRPGAFSKAIASRAARNVESESRVDVPASMRPKSGFGLFGLQVRAMPPIAGDVPRGVEQGVHLVSVTDLAVTTKWGPYGGLAWVTHLSSGAPVAGAAVSVRTLDVEATGAQPPADAAAFAATTDAQGIVRLPRELASRVGGSGAVLVARAGQDWTYARLSPPRGLAPLGVLFTERGLYRPGETVYAKGYFRVPGTQGGLESPSGREVEVTLDLDGRSVHTEKAVLDAFGAASFAIKLPPSKVGSADLVMRLAASKTEAKSGGNPEGSVYADFSVADYRAVEFKVDAHAERSSYTRGDLAKLDVSATYLFGAPLHDVPARVSYTRVPVRLPPPVASSASVPALAGFSFGDELFGQSPGAEPATQQTVTIGADGHAVASVPLALPGQRGAERIDFEADVDDVGKAFTVAGSAPGIVVLPGDFALGVRVAADPNVFAGDRLRVETVAVDPAGTLQRGVPVHLAFHEIAGSERRLLAECDAKAGEPTPRACAFAGPDPGTYAVLATASDTRGHSLFASTEVFLARKRLAPEPPASRQPPAKSETFDQRCATRQRQARGHGGSTWIEAEEPAYAPGDTARVCIGTPAPRALLTLEREGVLRYELLEAASSGGSGPMLAGKPMPLAITADLEPDARVAVHAVIGRRGPIPSREDGSRRPMATDADTGLAVMRPDKRLSVSIAPRALHPQDGPTPFRPGDEVDVDLSVLDGRGKPALAQVTFYAVDEGVDLLSPHPSPGFDPFWSPRGDEVRTDDTRDALYWEPLTGHGHVSRAPVLRQGATSVDRDFRGAGRKSVLPVAVFRPAILTGADGRATVRFTLPHNTTTWKLTAVAANDADGFGAATGQLVASQPFVVRPTLPRFLRAGDRAVATAVVDGPSDVESHVEASLSSSGAATGKGLVALHLAPGAHEAVAFDVAASRPGRAQVDLSVAGRDGRVLDGIEVALPVREPWELETVAFAGETRALATEVISARGLREDAGWLEYRVAATPLVALGEGIDQLLEYPYGCTEQLVSRLVPLLALRGLSTRYGLALPLDADARVREAVRGVLSHERPGGFAAWDVGPSNPWLTAYAAWGLSVAKAAGFDVPDGVIGRALRSLDTQEAAAKVEDLAFAEDVRASQGQARAEVLAKLAARTPLSVEARALLAHAAARLDPALARSLLEAVAVRASGATTTVAPEETEGSFPRSTARATALVLRAFLAVDAKNPMIPALIRGLLSLRERGRWATTQDAAWALLALADVSPPAAAATGPLDFRVRLGGRVVDQARLPASSLVAHTGFLTMAAVAKASTLSFESALGAPLFYEAYLRSAPSVPPSAALAHGLQIDRTYRVVASDGTPREGPIHAGDYVAVDVYVTSAAPRVQVVVDDPLPAGLEPISGAFATDVHGVAVRESFFNHREFRDERVVTFVDRLAAGTHHFAYRAHATTAGVFTAPPARAACMYAPDLFGRTDVPTVTILR